MEKLKLKQLLFKVAFCAMACDGEIDDREIEELKKINKNTSYFSDVDLSKELKKLKKEIKKKGYKILDDLLSDLQAAELNTIQELLILEIALRIINADEKIEENEKWFIKLIRSKLRVHNEILSERFGDTKLLFGNGYSEMKFNKVDTVSKFIVPEIKEIEKIKITKIVLK